MKRAEALTALARFLIRTSPSLDELLTLIESAGLQRLAAALREHRPIQIGNGPRRLDPAMWRSGRLK